MPKKLALSEQAGFIETMDCLPVSKPLERPEWIYEQAWRLMQPVILNVFHNSSRKTTQENIYRIR
jgi:hypothetical protein